MDLAFLEVNELHEKLKKKEISAVELSEYFLKRVKKYNPELNAYLTVTEQLALEQAKQADKIIASGEKFGALTGIPLAIKDLFLTEGVRTTASSKILDNFIPPYDATSIIKLKRENAVSL